MAEVTVLEKDVNEMQLAQDEITHLERRWSQDDELLHGSKEWRDVVKHVFILSEAGKPIYSRHFSEEKLVSLFGVMQALVSCVSDSEDPNELESIQAGGHLFVFLRRSPLILVAVSQAGHSLPFLCIQLEYLYNQVVSVLTCNQLEGIYRQRKNYDLRRLLGGAESLLNRLLDFTDDAPDVLLGAVRCLKLRPASIRDAISNALLSHCSKLRTLVYGVLLAREEVIGMVRMKRCQLHPGDIHLLLNLVRSNESFQNGESWAPICLPHFDPMGFLYCYVSYLSEDCRAILLLLTTDRDMFFPLSDTRCRIVESLRKGKYLEKINEAMENGGYEMKDVDASVGGIEHFLYKHRGSSQYTCSTFPQHLSWKRIYPLYQTLHQRIHSPTRPLKLLYLTGETECILAWETGEFEAYITFGCLVQRSQAIAAVNNLLKWIKSQESSLFLLNLPTF